MIRVGIRKAFSPITNLRIISLPIIPNPTKVVELAVRVHEGLHHFDL